MIIGLWWIVGGGEEEEEGRWLRCILWHKLHDPQIITDRLARQLLHKKEILASIDDICLSAQKIYSVCVQKTQPVCMFRKYIICAWSDNNFLCVCSANSFCVHVQKTNFCACSENTFCVRVQKFNSVCVCSANLFCVCWKANFACAENVFCSSPAIPLRNGGFA